MISFLVVLKKLFGALFFVFLFRPSKILFGVFFEKVLVKGYCSYLTMAKKFGLSKRAGGVSSLFSNQKLIHVIVVVLTFFIVFLNFVSKTKAGIDHEFVSKTIVAGMIQSEFGNLNDDELIEEYFDEELANTPVQQSYLDNKGVLQTKQKAVIKSSEEVFGGEAINSIIPGESVVGGHGIIATTKTKQPRKEAIKYTVLSGDTISTIAQNFDISVNTILWENNLSSHSLIRPGDNLVILPKTGVTHSVKSGENISSISKKYSVEDEVIIEENDIDDGSKLKIGQKLFIPGGKKYSYTSQSIPRYSGVSVIKDLVTPAGSRQVSNKMLWPTSGHRITQYYSWRHSGLDIADKTGTPLYASDSGVVVFADWSRGYGYNVLIDHGGGKKTRYAHCSKFYVKKGSRVSKGDTIAAMGSTGWSTGPHVHFEVIINGKKYNPLNYIR